MEVEACCALKSKTEVSKLKQVRFMGPSTALQHFARVIVHLFTCSLAYFPGCFYLKLNSTLIPALWSTSRNISAASSAPGACDGVRPPEAHPTSQNPKIVLT